MRKEDKKASWERGSYRKKMDQKGKRKARMEKGMSKTKIKKVLFCFVLVEKTDMKSKPRWTEKKIKREEAKKKKKSHKNE